MACDAAISIAHDSYVGFGSIIVARQSITIGAHALIAEYVTIRDQDHDYGGEGPLSESGFVTAPVVVGDNVWVGAKATITKGVTIGASAVIGANSVVTSDIPANSVAVGNPARVIRTAQQALSRQHGVTQANHNSRPGPSGRRD